MKILKFGGTSVGSVDGLLKISDIISQTSDRKIVVCSAMSGVTDMLLNLTMHIKERNEASITNSIHTLKERHFALIKQLFKEENLKVQMVGFISKSFDYIQALSKKEYSIDVECEIITYGERLLTKIYATYLTSIGIDNLLLDAREFMLVDEIETPNVDMIFKRLQPILEKNKQIDLYITQGFIRMTSNGNLRHLHRGGSDYSATLIGAALKAEEVQIWSDVDGFHNCDPRAIKNTFPIPYLSYDEAAELAYFGAKILHPHTVFPAKKQKIPVLLKNTFEVEAKGTIISSETPFLGRKAISVKSNLINLRMTYLTDKNTQEVSQKILSEFKKNDIDVYFTVDAEKYIEVTVTHQMQVYKIVNALEKLVKIDFENDLSIVCIVGYYMDYNSDEKLMEAIKQLSVNEIFCYSDILSTRILIDSKKKERILTELNNRLFAEKTNAMSSIDK